MDLDKCLVKISFMAQGDVFKQVSWEVGEYRNRTHMPCQIWSFRMQQSYFLTLKIVG